MNATEKRSRIGGRRFLARAALFVALLWVLDYAIGGVLTHGLKRYFGLAEDAPVLCVGHSRMVLGIDADILQAQLGLPVAKYTVRGANTMDRFAMTRHFLTEHRNVRLMIYDVESTSFAGGGLSSNSYRLFYPFIENREMASYLRQHTESSLEYRLRQVLRTSRFDEVTFSLAIRGLTGMTHNMKYGKFDPNRERRRIAKGRRRKAGIDARQYEVFLKTLRFAKQSGVQTILVHMPTADVLNAFDSENRRAVRQVFADLAAQDPAIHYIDFSTAFESRHDLFYDAIHMNALGQKVVSDALAQKIRSLPMLLSHVAENTGAR